MFLLTRSTVLCIHIYTNFTGQAWQSGLQAWSDLGYYLEDLLEEDDEPVCFSFLFVHASGIISHDVWCASERVIVRASYVPYEPSPHSQKF